MSGKIKTKKTWLFLAGALLATGSAYLGSVLNVSETKVDEFSSAGGSIASTNFESFFVMGESSPLGVTASANFADVSGVVAITYDLTGAPLTICVTFDFPVVGGAWYLVSLPVIPGNASVDSLFPGAISAFGWDYASQSYLSVSTLQPERAYWLLFLNTATAQVCGQPLDSYSTNYNVAGWDMVGAVIDSSALLIDSPPNSVISMFGWDPVGKNYVSISPYVAEPQQGYWILVFGVPSTVTVGSGASSSSSSSSGSGSSSVAKTGTRADLAAFHRIYGTQPPPPPSSVFGDQSSEISLPSRFSLSQNYPNPFNPETVIAYRLPEAGGVSLKIYNILGKEIRTLIDGEKPAGVHRVIWDGRNDREQRVESGVYFVRMQAGAFIALRKLLLVK